MEDVALMSREAAKGHSKGDSRGRVVIKQKSKKLEGRGDECEQLLPGIPNEITLGHVAPKLPWTAFHILSSVSHGWKQAIQSRQVYDARVRSQSTQTLIVTNQEHAKNVLTTLALLSVNDGACYDLPGIPGLSQGFPWSCQCSSLDGKLYVFGGFVRPLNEASSKAYVLDLAGQKQWKECASMAEPRAKFGCGVLNGKIYVFGGTSSNAKPVYCGSEVYDPKADAWSPIAPMQSPGLDQQVVPLGEELFVHTEFNESCYNILSRDYKGFPLEVYNPVNNQWRSMGMDELIKVLDILLAAGGKLHKLDGESIDIYDISANAWNHSQTFSFSAFQPRDSFMVKLLAAVAVGDELLAVVIWVNPNENDRGTCLMRSQGLGCQNKEIEWQKLQCSLSFDKGHCGFLCPIQL